MPAMNWKKANHERAAQIPAGSGRPAPASPSFEPGGIPCRGCGDHFHTEGTEDRPRPIHFCPTCRKEREDTFVADLLPHLADELFERIERKREEGARL